MALNINQFALSAIQGMLDLSVGVRQVLGCKIDSSSAGGLIAGQPVKLVDVKDGVPHVVECSDNADDVFGFIPYDIKDQAFNANDKVDVAFDRGAVMYMTASEAMAPNAKAMIVISGMKVANAVSGARVIGHVLDKALASGDLIRVRIDLPGAIL